MAIEPSTDFIFCHSFFAPWRLGASTVLALALPNMGSMRTVFPDAQSVSDSWNSSVVFCRDKERLQFFGILLSQGTDFISEFQESLLPASGFGGRIRVEPLGVGNASRSGFDDPTHEGRHFSVVAQLWE